MDLAGWQDWWKHFGAVELRHLLLVWWDPIGVYGVPQAIDEYDTYSGQIARMLREGSDARVIAEYLGDVTADMMGLSRAPAHDAEAARRIVEWYERAMVSGRMHRTS
jgi:hypothetical protein